jgi:hypothetical protein
MVASMDASPERAEKARSSRRRCPSTYRKGRGGTVKVTDSELGDGRVG